MHRSKCQPVGLIQEMETSRVNVSVNKSSAVAEITRDALYHVEMSMSYLWGYRLSGDSLAPRSWHDCVCAKISYNFGILSIGVLID